MKVNSLAVRIANFINNSHKTQKVLRKISDSPAVFSTVSASIIGFTLRPITTLAITKDKQDGKYGASSSIASSLVELGIGLALLGMLLLHIRTVVDGDVFLALLANLLCQSLQKNLDILTGAEQSRAVQCQIVLIIDCSKFLHYL